MDAAATAPGQNASPSRSNGPLLESAATQDGSAPDSASTLNGAPISSAVPPSPTAIRSGTPQTAPVGAISSAGSTAGSDSAQLVDTLHIVATDRNAVDKFDLYDLFSAQDGFQRIAWQNEGNSLSLWRMPNAANY